MTQAQTKVSFFYFNLLLQVEFRAIFEPFSYILLNDFLNWAKKYLQKHFSRYLNS